MTEQATGAHPQPRPRSRRTVRPPEHVTGAQSLIRSLEEVGADTVFGIPGGTILPAYDPLMDSTKVRHVLVRHEQGANHRHRLRPGHRQGGRLHGHLGPGATNLVTPIADANLDSVPLVAITGQVVSSAIGTDAFQEADIVGITMPITKHSFLVTKAEDIPKGDRAGVPHRLHRPSGPVLVDIPKDILQKKTTFSWPPVMDLPGYRPVTKPHAKQIREAAKLILRGQAPRPLRRRRCPQGEGHRRAEGPRRTHRSARHHHPDGARHVPTATRCTWECRACTVRSPPSPRCRRPSLIVALGARFDDRVTGKLDSFAPYAKIVHADIDPAEIGKNRAADVPIVGDAREVIANLVQAVQKEHDEGNRGDYTAWWKDLSRWRDTYPLGYDQPEDGSLSPQQVIEHIGQLAPEGTIFAAGVGQHQMWPRTSSSTRSPPPG
ncbi:Acetolactate synthase OS=Streptomyces tendae OX=1932 GN=GUR47_36590 PE=3 SV=1 [Streptomyces tendae]